MADESIEGQNPKFSRLWLYFDSPHERQFLTHLNERRARGTLDTILFALSALFSLAAIARTVKKASAKELPLLISCFVFSSIVTILFRSRYSDRGAFIRSKRIHLHVILHILHHIQTLQMLAKPEMVACANSRPMVEFLVLWWVFQALYFSVASVPLIYAAPSQLIITVTMLHSAPSLCQMGFQACTAAPQLYAKLASVFSVVSMIISFPLGIIDIQKTDPMTACYSTLIFLLIAILLVIFYSVCFHVELKVRVHYCSEKSDLRTARELNRCRVPILQLSLWLILVLIVCWRLAEFWFITRQTNRWTFNSIF